jgi:hypothetical protein
MNVLGFLFGNWLARAYLLLVAVVAVLVFVILEVGGEEANLAGVWLILVTLPGSLLASPVAGLASGPAQHGDLLLRTGDQCSDQRSSDQPPRACPASSPPKSNMISSGRL